MKSERTLEQENDQDLHASIPPPVEASVQIRHAAAWTPPLARVGCESLPNRSRLPVRPPTGRRKCRNLRCSYLLTEA